MEQQLKEDISTDSLISNGTKEIIYRTGKAAEPIREPLIIRLEGDINSIGEFLRKRANTPGFDLQTIDPSKAVVIVDKEKNLIELQLDPQNHFGASITGRLEESKELDIFKINESHEWSREDLIKLFRFNKIHFANPAKGEDLMKAFQKFSAKAYVDLVKEDDTRGNLQSSITKKVETGIPETFVLSIPIYKGQPKEEIEVSICLDVIGTRAAFWFESVQLVELLELRKEEIFNEQLKACELFPIINK